MKALFDKIQRSHREAGGTRNLLLHTAFTLTFTSGLSYVLGLVRDKTFAYSFGASSELDVYNAAFVIPDFFLALIVTGALSAAFVPVFTHLDEHDKKRAIEYTNQILCYCLLLLVVFSAIFALSLPYLVDFLVPGFDPAQKAQYIIVTRLMLISPVLFTISNTFGNVLLSTRQFLWYGLSPVMYNLGIIVGVFVFAPRFDVFGLVMGTVLGAALHLSIRIPSLIRYGYRPRLRLYLDRELKETAALMGPKMVQLGMWQILLWWFVRLASQLDEGSVTIYSFARNFQSVPVSLVGIAIALAAFAELSQKAAKRHYDDFGKIMRQKSLSILGYTSLAAVALAVLSTPIITILLGGGKFDKTAVAATASLLAVYCLSIPLESVTHLLMRGHYALKNTLIPSTIHVFAIIATMVSSYALIAPIGLFAIPVGFTIGLLIQSVLQGLSLAILLKQHLQKQALAPEPAGPLG